jgi:hypothetical protein
MATKYSVNIFTVIVILIVLVLFLTTPVSAFDARSDNAINVSKGEVINDDLYIGANTITIDGTVGGDIWAGARTIFISGPVKGSIMAVAQTIIISGDIEHAIRVAGEKINISGNVAGDLFVAGSEINIENTAHIKGDILLGAGVINIDGIVDGDIKGGGDKIIISNEVGGDINLEVNVLTILSTADIKGSLTYTGENRAVIQTGAQIAGTTIHKLPEAEKEQSKTFPLALFSSIKTKFIGFLMALITGLLIILIAPKRLLSIAESIHTRPGPSAGWGSLILFITPIAAIIVCITIIGLPVGLIALALWGMAMYLAQIPFSLFLGQWIISHFGEVKNSRGFLIGALAVGLLTIRLLTLIPYVGFFIILAVTLFGLGAIVVNARKQIAESSETATD